jgi:hypothetical protein
LGGRLSARPVLRAARVVSTSGGSVELELLEGPLRGEAVRGIAFGTAPAPGDLVTANTVGLEMGLGTGGVAPILPPPGGEATENRDHFVKLPYTPLQFPAPPPPQAESLAGIPVVVLPLHSHLAPACCAAATMRPGCAVRFVWQEGGALPVAFSSAVRDLREKGLLSGVVSAGGCYGGDVEAPNIYSGLLAAAVEADLVLVGIGPGVVGSALPYAHGGMAAAVALNAASALGAEPVFAPRVSDADARERHRGISHHTRAVLEATLSPCRVALPGGLLPDGMPERHLYERSGFGASGSEEVFGVTFSSMGRGYGEDPIFFDAAAAAVALALGEGEE